MVKTILSLHALLPDSRRTTLEHVYSVPRYGPGNLYIMHHVRAPVTPALERIKFDGVIINYCFLGHRATRLFEEHKRRFSFISKLPCPKIAICQDDYSYCRHLDEWLDTLNVNVVYSPITRDLDRLYPIMSRKEGVEIREGLTGYVYDGMTDDIADLALPFGERRIDVGTRVRALGPHYGPHGQRKALVAERFCREAEAAGFAADYSSDRSKVLLGKDWLRFLGACKTTVGCRGGASIADPDGSLRAQVETYLQTNPDADYETVKAACFPAVDDNCHFDAIGPRLFEAAVTRTCQVLIKDDYLGLVPYEDYIPLEADFSNLAEVFELMRNDGALVRMADSSRRKLIDSGRFSYGSFVDGILNSIPDRDTFDEETPHLVAQHFEQLRPFLDLAHKTGHVVNQASKRAAMLHITSNDYSPAGASGFEAQCSAIEGLIRSARFPRHPQRFFWFNTARNWVAAEGAASEYRDALASVEQAPELRLNLDPWSFCECIYDSARSAGA